MSRWLARVRRFLLSIDRQVRALSASRLFWTIIMVDLILLGAIGILALGTREARFTVVAHTQFIELRVDPDEPMAGWDELAVESIQNDDSDQPCSNPRLKMPFRVRSGFRMIAEGSAAGGLALEFIDVQPGALGQIQCTEGSRPAGRHVVLQFAPDQAKNLALPVRGRLTLGQDVKFDSNQQSLLIDGTIYSRASGAFFGTGSYASETRLSSGDRVTLTKADGQTSVQSSALIRMENGLLAVTAHADAAQAQVIHFGQTQSAAEVVAPNLLARVQAQSGWAVLVLVLGVLIHMLSALRDYRSERELVEIERGKHAR